LLGRALSFAPHVHVSFAGDRQTQCVSQSLTTKDAPKQTNAKEVYDEGAGRIASVR